MNNKTSTIIVAVCGIILIVFLAVATVRITRTRQPEPPAVSEVEEPEE